MSTSLLTKTIRCSTSALRTTWRGEWLNTKQVYTKDLQKKYKVNKLVYFENSPSITAAIEREKQLKAGSRVKKLALINESNPYWNELAAVGE